MYQVYTIRNVRGANIPSVDVPFLSLLGTYANVATATRALKRSRRDGFVVRVAELGYSNNVAVDYRYLCGFEIGSA